MYSEVPSLTVSFLFNELNLNFRDFVLPYLHTSVLIPWYRLAEVRCSLAADLQFDPSATTC